MAGSAVRLVDYVKEHYLYAFSEGQDERIAGWPLTENEFTVIGISLAYIFGVCWLGPHLMRNRKPFRLKSPMTAYNVVQVLFSGWIFYLCMEGGWFNGYNFQCQPTERAPSRRGLIMLKMMWWYYISKYVDFIDTVFFVMRKKYSQISFLHIFHHGFVPFGAWYGMKFLSGGNITIICLLNSLVHTIMYTYYFLAGMGPAIQKYLWWKKYLTILQLVQFVIIFIHLVQLLFIDCSGVPKYPSYWGFLFGPWFFLLFLQFYLKSYRARNEEERRIAAS